MFINPNDTFDFDLPLGQRVALYSGPGNGTATIERVFYSYSSQKTELLASVTNETKVIGPFTDNLRIRVTAGTDLAELSFGPPSAISLSLPPPLVFGDLEAQSIIEPAATFVTLTFQEGTGGRVELVSAGAHGLTNAVAVGNDLFVTWTGGIGVNGFYEITALDADTTGVEIEINLAYIDSTVTITIASPAVITWTGHGLSVNDTIRLTTTGALPTGLATGTTYFVKEVLSSNTFTVSATAGGPVINTSGTQSGTHTAFVYYGVPVVAVANTAVTLASFTIPGWSMAYGGGMDINALWTLTNSAAAKNLGMTYGGGVLLAVSAANNASACAEKLVCNRGNNEVITNPTSQLGHGLSTGANVFLAVNAMEDQTFTFTAQPATANNVVKLEAYKVLVTF